MADLAQVWDDYYAQCAGETALKDRNFFRLEVEQIVAEVRAALDTINRPEIQILELGSATGFLAAQIIEGIDRLRDKAVSYTGVDFSEIATRRATERNLKNATFAVGDFIEFLTENKTRYDIIVTQRSIMALLEANDQLRLLKLIREHLKDGGVGVFSEGSRQALDKLNSMRAELGVTAPFEKVWHSLYLDEDIFGQVFSKVSIKDFSSTYWLITRVLYPYFEEPKHNTALHDFAAALDQSGAYGLVKLFLVRP